MKSIPLDNQLFILNLVIAFALGFVFRLSLIVCRKRLEKRHEDMRRDMRKSWMHSAYASGVFDTANRLNAMSSDELRFRVANRLFWHDGVYDLKELDGIIADEKKSLEDWKEAEWKAEEDSSNQGS